jgi:ribosome-binding factor A
MSIRLTRIAALLKKEVSHILRTKINDSRIGFVSITEIKVSSDLAHAWIYYSHLGTLKERKETQKGLMAAQKYIKFEIGKNLHLTTVPDLKFIYDESLEKGTAIVNKLNELSKCN